MIKMTNRKFLKIGVFLFLLLVFAFFVQGCSSKTSDKTTRINKTSEHKKVEFDATKKHALLIIAPVNFRDEELVETKKALENKGIVCNVASIANSAVGMKGLKVKPDLLVNDVDVINYDAVVVIGGSGSLSLSTNSIVLNILKEAELQNKIIGGICLGPVALANAGVLKNKSATVFKTVASLNALKNNNAKFVDKKLVSDGNVVTANNYDVADKFGNKIAELIMKNES